MAVQQNFRDVDEYIGAATGDAAAAMTQIRGLVYELAPETTERISYHIPMFELSGHRLTYMAAYKAHIGMYGIGGIREEFGERIGPYVNEKGSLRFPLREPMPLDLIADILRFSIQSVHALPPKQPETA